MATKKSKPTKAKKKRGEHVNSRANIAPNEGRFADVPGAAAAAGRKSGIVRKTRAEVERLLNENLDEALSLLSADISREDFMKVASNGRNQMQRILAREFSDPSKAFDAVGWAFDRVLGRSLQQIRQQQTVDFKPEKPVIIFKDIERQVRDEQQDDNQQQTDEEE